MGNFLLVIEEHGHGSPGKGCCQEKIPEKCNREPQGTDIPESPATHVVPRSHPQSLQVLPRIDDSVAQGIEPDVPEIEL